VSQGGLPEPPAPRLSADGVSRALLARYFLNEASNGQAPAALLDSAPVPFALPLTYSGANPSFQAWANGRGLYWDTAGNDARACADVSPGKVFDSLNGSMTLTYEAVVDFQALSGNGTRIIHIGEGMSWNPALGATDCGGSDRRISAKLGTGGWMSWLIDLTTTGRTALALVIDTREALPADRVRLYRDGALLPMDRVDTGICNNTPDAMVPQNATFDLTTPGTQLCVGNRSIGQRSPQGIISYAAVYGDALTPAEIATNANLLLANDDE
jgi:hypothetical protein